MFKYYKDEINVIYAIFGNNASVEPDFDPILHLS